MPNVNPNILVWARETAGLDVQAAAKKLQIHDGKVASAEEKLDAYEKGKIPSRSLLVRMAKQYRRPLLTFYLNEQPREGDRGEDYRTLHPDRDPSEDAIVDALVRNIKARQSIVREAILTAGEAEELSFIGSATTIHGIAPVVRAIREATEIDLEEYRNRSDQNGAFKYLRERVESLGVFSLLAGNLGSHHTNLDPDVFRGFALSDDIAPFVVVNDQDSKTAWSFTLLHEVAHLWLGATGISGGTADRAIEWFCNDTATELLLPEAELASSFPTIGAGSFDVLAKEVDNFASARKVSSRLVAYRLFRKGSIQEDVYRELGEYFYERWRNARDRQRIRSRSEEGGPSYYVVKKHRVGSALLGLAQRMLSSGELSTTQVGTVLGVRALKVGNMFAETLTA